MTGGIWNYLFGYVIIQISGTSLERFINLALHSGLEIWNVRRTGPTVIEACVSRRDFFRLRAVRRGIRAEIRILEKRGLPVWLTALRFRKVLLFGWTLVMAGLFILSGRIWTIEVAGCDRVEVAEISAFLQSRGVKPGAEKKGVLPNALADEIMASDERIAWAGVNIEGVCLTVKIVEAEDGIQVLDESAPASIYAAKDGVIKRITALYGKPMFVAGDAVIKGELLISGALRGEDELAGGERQIYVRARGEVVAEVLYTFTAQAGPKLPSLVRTGRSVSLAAVELSGRELFPPQAPYERYELECAEQACAMNNMLPMTAKRYICYELADGFIQADRAELEAAATAGAEELMARGVPESARIITKKTQTRLLEGGGVEAEITLTTEEDIATTVELAVDEDGI